MTADIAWSLLLGALVALGPHTSASRVVPSVAGGVLVAVATFAYRRFKKRRTSGGGETDAGSRTGYPVPAVTWACLGVALLLFLPTLRWLYSEYTVSVWRNGHGLFLPVIIYGLAKRRIGRAPSVEISNSLWGLPLLALSTLLALVESVTNVGFAGAIGLVLAVPGLSLLLLGTAMTRTIAAPLALSVFLIPVPEVLVDPLALPSVSAALAEPMLRGLGVPVLRDQTSLVLPVSSFGVSANCSGLSTFYSALLLTLILCEFATSWPKRAFLLLLTWPVTVIVNSFRVTFLVGSSNAIGFDWFLSPVHGMSGILSFWLTIAVLCALGWREMRRMVSA